MRADLYLHHVRIFKTRSLATQACNKGNVRIGTQTIKPARELKNGDTLEVVRGEMTFILRVVDFPQHRVGAALVAQFMENLTPPENYQRAAAARKEREMIAPEGFGTKPDKKQLRAIRALLGRDEE